MVKKLREDFSVYLHTHPLHEHTVSEALAAAATDFISTELGEIDDELALDLALELMNKALR